MAEAFQSFTVTFTTFTVLFLGMLCGPTPPRSRGIAHEWCCKGPTPHAVQDTKCTRRDAGCMLRCDRCSFACYHFVSMISRYLKQLLMNENAARDNDCYMARILQRKNIYIRHQWPLTSQAESPLYLTYHHQEMQQTPQNDVITSYVYHLHAVV